STSKVTRFFLNFAKGNSGRGLVMLAHAINKRRIESNERLYNVYRPNSGLSSRLETLAEIKKRCRKVITRRSATGRVRPRNTFSSANFARAKHAPDGATFLPRVCTNLNARNIRRTDKRGDVPTSHVYKFAGARGRDGTPFAGPSGVCFLQICTRTR